MNFLHRITSPVFKNCINFSLKTLKRDFSYKINIEKRYLSSNVTQSQFAPVQQTIRKLHTTYFLKKNMESLSSSKNKRRFQRKKVVQQWKENLNAQTWSAVAYSTAERYNMPALIQQLETQGVYQRLPLPNEAEDNLHLCIRDESAEKSSHIYIFSEGCIVFWNISESQQQEMLNFLKPFERKPYDADLIHAEKDDLDYMFSEDETTFNDGYIILNSNTNTDLHAYTFSNSLALSVKLGILEETLQKFIDDIEWVTDKLEAGEDIKLSRKEIYAKTGKLLSFRKVINLSLDLLDTPDFYWDNKDLEVFYHRTCRYLDIPKRMTRMNERLSYCSDEIHLLLENSRDNHHVRLEWIIIILIALEFLSSIMHYFT